MEHALQELVQALKLDTEFFQGGVKHRRSIAKPKPSQNLKRSKKRKAKDQNDPLNDGDSPMQMDEISPTQLQSESSRQTEESLSQNDEEAAILIPATAVHEENVPIEIQELWDIEPSSIIGLGAFGIVRFERRRPQIANSTQTSHNQVRAVKEIRKASTVDYMKELQAIAKFSQSQYQNYFVQSYGWFQNEESVFITMEYLRLGDLAHFRERDGPFLQQTAGLIIRQVLEATRFMHEINWAHRDLKPANILIVSTSPWKVKIADFGISKQCHEGTQLQTQLGTPSYMAPEQKGYFRSLPGTSAYSVSVDIWAIGVITMELILTHPFLYSSDQDEYIRGKPLDFDDSSLAVVTASCRDFVKSLLTPNPIDRPNAEVAISHSWFAEVALCLDAEDSPFVRDEVIPSQRINADAVTPMPLISWSTFGNMRLTNGSQRTNRTTNSSSTRGRRNPITFRSTQGTTGSRTTMETGNTAISTYVGRSFDSTLLAPMFRQLSLDTVKYFVCRSINEADVALCFAHSRWTAMPAANKRLDNGYKRTDGNVLIFFSVVGSRELCGVAKMASPVDWTNTDFDWAPRADGKTYQGRFTIDWVWRDKLSFDRVKHVPAHLGKQRLAVAVMDGQEICSEAGYEFLRAYSEEDRISPRRIERGFPRK